jgi:hypothetical protein
MHANRAGVVSGQSAGPRDTVELRLTIDVIEAPVHRERDPPHRGPRARAHPLHCERRMMNLRIAVAALAFSFATGCAAPDLQLATTSQDSQTDFAQMVAGTIGIRPGLTLLNYGCYCGLGNDVGVIPLDATDACCMTHDYAWMGAPQGCDCNTQAYNYTRPGGVITCAPNQGACADYCCAADKAFSECVQGTAQNAGNANYNRTLCQPIECLTDDDCEGGTWCNNYTCVPMCGGGIGFATRCDISTTTTAGVAP